MGWHEFPGYIITVGISESYESNLLTYLWSLGIPKEKVELYEVFSDVEEYQTYNNYGNKLDWIEKARGIKYPKIDQMLYLFGLKMVREGKKIYYIQIHKSIDLEELLEGTIFKIEEAERWSLK